MIKHLHQVVQKLKRNNAFSVLMEFANIKMDSVKNYNPAAIQSTMISAVF